MKTVSVVVLGEIARSPRMRYHSLSLAKSGYKVNVLGFGENPKDFSSEKNISVHSMAEFPNISIPRLLKYFLKTLWQSITLCFALILSRSDYVIMQNPPAVPTIFICWFYCLLFRAKFIIDWHNYAFTIMSLSVGKQHGLVKVTKLMESYFGRKAHANFCVTNAMKKDLKEQWQIEAVTLYDRPPLIFQPISLEDKHKFWLKLGKTFPVFSVPQNPSQTVFSSISKDGKVSLKKSRPGLLVSSTSWTEDEDFGILLHALEEYEKSCKESNLRKLPELICVITGNGPLKEHYKKLMNEHEWKFVTIITPWLETADYPLMLASADLGVCLHFSSSGLDLPMKVVDMFGAGLPVCAYNFQSLPELVKHEQNGLIFNDAMELTNQLLDWFENFPNNQKQIKNLAAYKTDLETFQKLRWEENWNNHALPTFN